MNSENRELLEKVIKNRLDEALTNADDDAKEQSFKEAMDAVGKSIEFDKLKNTRDIEDAKNEIARRDNKRERIIKWVGLGATVVAVPVIEVLCKQSYAKVICSYEKDDIFTTSAGKGLAGLLKLK